MRRRPGESTLFLDLIGSGDDFDIGNGWIVESFPIQWGRTIEISRFVIVGALTLWDTTTAAATAISLDLDDRACCWIDDPERGGNALAWNNPNVRVVLLHRSAFNSCYEFDHSRSIVTKVVTQKLTHVGRYKMRRVQRTKASWSGLRWPSFFSAILVVSAINNCHSNSICGQASRGVGTLNWYF